MNPNGGTPFWLPILILAIPVVIMLVAVRSSARFGIRFAQIRRAIPSMRRAETTELGSAAKIADPSGYSPEALLKALAVRPDDPDSYDEAYYAKMLGLKFKLATGSTEFPEPTLMWGSHDGAQVFIRLGADELATWGLPTGNKHYRHITVLRVASPRFELALRGGVLAAGAGAPPEARVLLGGLTPDPIIWNDTHVVAGPEGLVAARPGVDPLALGFVYDLWLLERLAALLDLKPLAAAALGPKFKIPYGVGRSLRAGATA